MSSAHTKTRPQCYASMKIADNVPFCVMNPNANIATKALMQPALPLNFLESRVSLKKSSIGSFSSYKKSTILRNYLKKIGSLLAFLMSRIIWETWMTGIEK